MIVAAILAVAFVGLSAAAAVIVVAFILDAGGSR